MGELLTFDQVLRSCKNPHLLLGNGFSIAYDKNRFSFTTLLESAVKDKIIDESSEVYEVFQKLETADFESVMRALIDTAKILSVYADDKELHERILKDSENLKEYLVKIITNNHPEKSTSLLDTEKDACLSFLKPFKRIYTLNYDLLLYWSSMRDKSGNFTDGFGNTEDSLDEGYVVYGNNSISLRVYYLHGALHYFDADSEIIKKTYANTDIPLVEQVRGSLDEGKYPVFVSEGTSDQKKTKIIHNAYLNHCYKSLKSISGDLVIFGSALKKNDEHILEAILESKVKNIYTGVSSPSSVDHIYAAIDLYNKKHPSKRKSLYLYDYRTVNVWGR